ncbi:hypothetical protein [Pseudomonas sp. PH1b]|uniref:hypothetical protein n=1 Tax=Pseudomonas sp. PH1b TaxID=1397282 RepID=UPI000AA15A1C|nr:hypothetical protein [Pseudomonas sp. PH1b]
MLVVAGIGEDRMALPVSLTLGVAAGQQAPVDAAVANAGLAAAPWIYSIFSASP